MRTSIALSCLSALLLAIATPLAQSADTICTPARRVPPQLLAPVTGVYHLSNGDILRISKDARRFFADMTLTGRFQIVPLSEEVFAERGGPVRFDFSGAWPDIDVLISGLEQPRPVGPVCPRS